MQRVTIKDLAKILNCSISTISRAFNDKYDINPETKERILAAAKEIGYSPNPIAKHLSQKRSYLIGVVVPEFINAFFPTVITGMQKVLRESGYQLLIMSSEDNAINEMENMKLLEKNMVDGIMISLTHEAHDISYYKELNDRIPIIQFNRVSKKLNTSKVIFDDYTWACKATEHLILQGYKKLYHLCGPSNLIVSHIRKKGFIDTVKKYNLNNYKCIESGIFINDGYQSINQLIKNNDLPDAIFCFNDPLAIAAIQIFKSASIRVPEDVGIIGFTESRIAAYTSPSLSSVKQPATEIGETAARQLILEIESEKRPEPKIFTLNGTLNIRESSVLNNNLF